MGAPQATLARANLRRARSSHIDDMLSFLHAKTTIEDWPDPRVWKKISEQKCLVSHWKLSHTLLLCFVLGPHNNCFTGFVQVV